MKQQPWIGKPLTDILFILFPPFGCLLFIALFPSLFLNNKNMPDAAWVVLILLIDVAHVYSTLYRTYFDTAYFQKQRSILLTVPFIGFIGGVLIYSMSSMLFWRLLAYTAVFHFVRQQYGFLRVYSRKEPAGSAYRLIDSITIYTVTLYPLLYWHLNGPRNFNWFLANDFLYIESPFLSKACLVIYILVCSVYIVKETIVSWKAKWVNLPKILVVLGTALSWYFGIVYFNGDMAFTLLNVVSHGIPYMALVWIYGKKSQSANGNRFLRIVFSRSGVILFILVLAVFAFIEEGLWDLFVWKEHSSIFGTNALPGITIPNQWLAFIVPLLTLPQLTHYILDGFIWRIRKGVFSWKG